MLQYKTDKEDEENIRYYCNNDCWQQAREANRTGEDIDPELPMLLSKRGNARERFYKFLLCALLVGVVVAKFGFSSYIKTEMPMDSMVVESSNSGVEEEL